MDATCEEFVRSLEKEELKDKKLLLMYFRLDNEVPRILRLSCAEWHAVSGALRCDRWIQRLSPEKGSARQVSLASLESTYRMECLVQARLVREDGMQHNFAANVFAASCCPEFVTPRRKSYAAGLVENEIPDDFDDRKKRELAEMLRAHAGLFPSVGYCQGMNFVAGFILMIAGRVPDAPKDAFFLLVQIMVKCASRHRAIILYLSSC
eukprot:g1487.t1